MKKTLALIVLTIFGGLVAGTIPALAQSNATTNLNSVYAQWMTFSTNAVTATAQTVVPTTCYVNTASFGARTLITAPLPGKDFGRVYAMTQGAILLSGKCTGTVPAADSAINGLSGWDPTQVLACSTVFAPTTAAGDSG
jgi:uncharacterized protein YraI